MAKMRLGRYEVENRALPPVCVRCGDPAEVWKNKKFAWHPSWVSLLILIGLLPYVIVALILTKRMRVKLPLCLRHRHHWLMRGLTLLFGVIVIVGLVVLAFWLPSQMDPIRRRSFEEFAPFSVLVGFLAFIVLAVICQQTSIRPVHIGANTITLTGLCDAFVEAVSFQRQVPSSEKYADRSEDEDGVA